MADESKRTTGRPYRSPGDVSPPKKEGPPKSRTQKKKEDRALQKLGEALLSISPDQLAKVEMPQELAEAVRQGRHMTQHGARRRHLQYIGALMRQVEVAPIRNALANIRRGDDQNLRLYKKLEGWREALLEGDPAVVEDVLAQCPTAERQRLLQLVRNARKASGTPKAVKSSRMLFRYLRQILGP
ncbi:MAG: ribosome biogenesis factor YjgA [Desulfobacterales bacterium]